MIIHRDDVQAVFKLKELKSYCKSKEVCEICVFSNLCPFDFDESIRNMIEDAACDVLVSGELGEDLKEGDKNE